MKVLSIIVPVYNEEKTIQTLLDKLLKQKLGSWRKEIIVIDDGSNDQTYNLLKKYKKEIVLIKHIKNMGRGSAVRNGLKQASGDAIIFQDADLEYDPADLPKLLDQLNFNDDSVIYGNRMHKNNKKGYISYYVGNKLITLLTNLLYGTKLHDTYTGYKLYNSSLLKSLPLKSTGFELEAEITALVLKKNIQIKEVPISYTPRSYAEGKKIFYNDGIIGVWTLLRHRFSAI